MDSTEFPTNPFFGRRVRACGARPRPRTRLRRLRAAARSSPASPAGSPLERAHRADARQTTRQTTITTPLTRYLLAQRERRSGSQTTGCFLSNEEARNCSPSFHTQVPEREREREEKKVISGSFAGESRGARQVLSRPEPVVARVATALAAALWHRRHRWYSVGRAQRARGSAVGAVEPERLLSKASRRKKCLSCLK